VKNRRDRAKETMKRPHPRRERVKTKYDTFSDTRETRRKKELWGEVKGAAKTHHRSR